MARKQVRAAIYCRISDARDGDTAGVDRQAEDAKAHVKAKGYDLVGEYIDNNRSAFKPGGKRPAYDRLMRSVEADEVDVIVTYAADRLYRRLTDLESLADLLGRHQVTVEALRSGTVDLSTADGQMHAGMLAVVAKHESQKRGERVARAARQRSEAGRFNGGVRRFGYTPDCSQLVPEEADALRFAYEQVAAGSSIRTVWREWQARGLKGPYGGTLPPTQISTLLRRPCHAGLASYQGNVVGTSSTIPPIVGADLWRTVQAILADPARVKAPRGRPTLMLVTGFMRCGVCGDKCHKHIRPHGSPAYACAARKCVTRSSGLVDDYIIGLLGEWLGRNAARISKPAPKRKAPKSDPAAQAMALRAKLDDLALLLAAGDLAASDYARATREVRSRLDVLEAQAAEEVGLVAIAGLAKADDVREAWTDLSTDGKRTVIAELLACGVIESITLMPKGQNRDRDPGVEVKWRKA
jgi:DNA invertase Pin-like site-specific DNA recombinase